MTEMQLWFILESQETFSLPFSRCGIPNPESRDEVALRYYYRLALVLRSLDEIYIYALKIAKFLSPRTPLD
jgi:hypothetical protein